MEIEHTAYRQIMLVFGIVFTPNTDFESLTQIKFNICSHWLDSVWKHNAQHIAELFGIASVFGIEVQIEVGQYSGSKLSRSNFVIEVEIEVDRI